VPGKLRRSVSAYEGTFCIVRPWEVESDEKGDVIYTFTRHQAALMQTKGYLKELES